MTTFLSKFKQHIKFDPLYFGIGFGTWLMVASISLLAPSASSIPLDPLVSGHLLVLIAALIAINEAPYPGGYYPRYAALLLQWLATVWLWTLQADSFLAIYSIMLVAQLNFFFSNRLCFIYIVASMGLFLGIQIELWQYPHALRETLLFTGFHFFSWLIASRTATEQHAKEEAQQAYQAIEASSVLLIDSSKQGERLRIARELHDTIGHQLTALSIKLEVASLACRDNLASQTEVNQCRELTAQLLCDVRAVVSDIRNTQPLNFAKALHTMVEKLPKLKVQLEMPELIIDRADIANALLRSIQEAITNCLRHSSGNLLILTFSQSQTAITLTLKDDGILLKPIFAGNGLSGMAERIHALGGTLNIEANIGEGLQLIIHLPIQAPTEIRL